METIFFSQDSIFFKCILHIITWKQCVFSDSHVQETAMLHPAPHLKRHPRYFWENVFFLYFLPVDGKHFGLNKHQCVWIND